MLSPLDNSRYSLFIPTFLLWVLFSLWVSSPSEHTVETLCVCCLMNTVLRHCSESILYTAKVWVWTVLAAQTHAGLSNSFSRAGEWGRREVAVFQEQGEARAKCQLEGSMCKVPVREPWDAKGLMWEWGEQHMASKLEGWLLYKMGSHRWNEKQW